MKEATAALTAIKALAGTISVVSVVLSVVNASVVAALNTLGVLGVAGLTIGFGTWAGSGGERLAQIRNTGWAVGITTAIGAVLMAAGRPMSDDEKQAGLLTVIGVVYLLSVLTLIVMAYTEIQASSAPVPAPTKKCPMCAELVLEEAKKCKHCGHMFDVVQPGS